MVKRQVSNFFIGIFSLIFLFNISLAKADIRDPLNPFENFAQKEEEQDSDKNKSAEELIKEAEDLFLREQPLDARTKLLKAVRKDPSNYRAYTLLAGYYLVHVGHFRLALKYINKALSLFKKKNGEPPYDNWVTIVEHARILQLLGQIKLNLDKYEEALQVWDKFEKLGYWQEWYPSSKAWTLLKLGRINEAIQTASLGLRTGANQGSTLNVLGILFSMSGNTEQALKVFDAATKYEMSLGANGQPATPLNNAGEVYREIFDETMAEQYWRRAIALPSGCDNILPSLNLANLLLEQYRVLEAKEAMDNFESCVSQFPLKNGEEHRALLEYMRARIYLVGGYPDKAIKLLNLASEHQQWFGKIGSKKDDLEAAIKTELIKALEAKNNRLRFSLGTGLLSSIARFSERVTDRIKIWWLRRKVLTQFISEMNNFEDLKVRNTDSLLDYSSLGFITQTIPKEAFKRKIYKLIRDDGGRRPLAKLYYYGYLAQNLLYHGELKEGLSLINKVVQELREPEDRAFRIYLLTSLLKFYKPESRGYQAIASEVFSWSRAALSNEGLILPVRVVNMPRSGLYYLKEAGFFPVKSSDLSILLKYNKKGKLHIVKFTSQKGEGVNITVRGSDLKNVIQKLADTAFKERFLRDKEEKEK
ncbi:MAG: hypothetical protein D6780_04810 [Candidatus Dadabacteria bacterium]|nr:MAG: hypothetical protein D6780_04810 [Candidatus Dadabacteria bacterium]